MNNWIVPQRGRCSRTNSRERREADIFWSALTGAPAPQLALRSATPGLLEDFEEDFLDETSPAPRAIPAAEPVPFAANPPPGSFWPVQTRHARATEINYLANDGTAVGGNPARRFLADRSHGSRYHVGIDLFANRGDPVVAVANGRIVAFYPFCCGDNKTSWALFVDHESVVINYGEVAPDSLSANNLSIGSVVRAGDVIGRVGVNPGGSSMIHFETYVAGTRRNHSWYQRDRRPAALLNPTSLLIWLRDNGRTTGASSVPGSSAQPPIAPAPALPPATPSAPPPVAPRPPVAQPCPPVPTTSGGSATTDWTRASETDRMRYAVGRLVSQYGYPLNGAAGIVGNLYSESGVLPSRVEGSRASTPMRARNFANVETDFSAREVMNRDRSAQVGPRLPGAGLAQWTSANRRRGLFAHSYQGVVLGENILFSMDAQLDYLVHELRTDYVRVDRVLRNPTVSVDDASDEVVYNFEVPGAVLSDRRKLPRTDPAVLAVFEVRRRHSQRALRAAPAATSRSTEAQEAWEGAVGREAAGWEAAGWEAGEAAEDLDEPAFRQAVLEEQSRRARARGRVQYAPVPANELATVEGQHRLRTAAAAQCRALLSAARSALADAQAANDARAGQTTSIGVASSYRDPASDGQIWHQLFPQYYRETAAERAALVGGPHGPAAVAQLAGYISQRKAAPGFSNHSDGRSIDFSTLHGGVSYGPNTSQRLGWKRTWLHAWLVSNAERFNFYPLATEEWHWDYRATPPPVGAGS